MTYPGEIIRECRDALKWPRSRLSEKSGIQVNVIRNIEMCGTDCRVSTFDKLLSTMGYEILIVKKTLV